MTDLNQPSTLEELQKSNLLDTIASARTIDGNEETIYPGEKSTNVLAS